jgi:predicted NUDIX family NTP pyrophosphohydrolase
LRDAAPVMDCRKEKNLASCTCTNDPSVLRTFCEADHGEAGLIGSTMIKRSAGLLLYRVREGVLEVFLVHPGGPFWAKKDLGAWSIPKGEIDEGEDPLEAARREFEEETGFRPEGMFRELTPVRQRSGKIVHAWAVEGDCDATAIRSNTITIEWPPRSGRQLEIPEVDRAGWFSIPEAREKILDGQRALMAQVELILRQEGKLQ